MLTQSRGHTGIALLLFILASALVADHVAAPLTAQGGPTPLRAGGDLGQADPFHPARDAGAPAAAHATRSIAP
ncbi:hypothetical protein [Sorangium sp. So ce887]|uniref:hypothetical protein n=1 Tax=Sorangium sp. So ce887 TaxID=3133324 RepID=UPI003F61355F